jgi:hypothetical protein
MSLSTRLLIYVAALLIGGLLFFALEYQRSAAAYESDKSAFAWMGFLPFLFPIFLMYSAMFVGPTALVVEITLWVMRLTGRA